MTKFFVTGATGYIGGDALHTFTKAHPDWQISALVRNEEKGAKLKRALPDVRLVTGELDSADVIEDEAKKADVVCHFAHAAHAGSVEAIIKGLKAHDPSKPGFFIHTSGTGVLLGEDIMANTWGEARDKVFNDLADVGEVTSLPDNPLRNVDKLVLAAGAEHCERVKTAIVCPPTIYGTGRGPCNKRSHQIPALCKCTLERGHGLKVNQGKNIWGNVHIHDLSKLYLKLAETAAAGISSLAGKPSIWGPAGYYFCENGEHVWGDVAQKIVTEAYELGLTKKDSVESISADEANKLTFWGSGLWGANSRGRAKRAKAIFDWTPTGASLVNEIRPSLLAEADGLDLHVCGCKRRADAALDSWKVNKSMRSAHDMSHSLPSPIEVQG